MSEYTATLPSGGWYPDPEVAGRQRYWDGASWTDHIHVPNAAAPPPPGAQQSVVYVQQAGNGLAIGALVCGIVGSVFGLIPLTYLVALALGLVAFVLGIMGRRKAKREPMAGRQGVATAGIVLGVIALGLGIAGAAIVNDAVEDLNTSVNCIDQADNLAQLDRC